MAAGVSRGSNQPPKVIVKKIYIEAHGGHHGGAWKVAYADFVTAMMAFFLLLWLLGATTEKQRKGIADYFAPTLIDTRTVGIGGSGPAGGDSMRSDSKSGPHSSQSIKPDIVSPITMPTEGEGGPRAGTGDKGSLRSQAATVAEDKRAFAAMRTRVLREITSSAQLSKLAGHVRFVMTRDGLRIDLIDDANYSMFALGTTALEPDASKLVGMVAGAIARLGNPIMIRGHTDALFYGDPREMNNWTLASGRAEATRRRLVQGGIPEARFARIEGVADREPMIASNPYDPRNRRVSVTLLYRTGAFDR